MAFTSRLLARSTSSQKPTMLVAPLWVYYHCRRARRLWSLLLLIGAGFRSNHAKRARRRGQEAYRREGFC